jgi:hypothetical protein
MPEARLDSLERVVIQRRRDLVAVWKETRKLVAILRARDAHGAEGVAVITVLERYERVPLRVKHGGLDRELHRLGAAGRAKALGQVARSDPREERGKLLPWAVAVLRVHIVGPTEALDAPFEVRIAPSEVADAPPHHEIDVALAARVEEIAARGPSDVEVAVSLFAKMALAPLSCRQVDDSARRSSAARRL